MRQNCIGTDASDRDVKNLVSQFRTSYHISNIDAENGELPLSKEVWGAIIRHTANNAEQYGINPGWFQSSGGRLGFMTEVQMKMENCNRLIMAEQNVASVRMITSAIKIEQRLNLTSTQVIEKGLVLPGENSIQDIENNLTTYQQNVLTLVKQNFGDIVEANNYLAVLVRHQTTAKGKKLKNKLLTTVKKQAAAAMEESGKSTAAEMAEAGIKGVEKGINTIMDGIEGSIYYIAKRTAAAAMRLPQGLYAGATDQLRKNPGTWAGGVVILIGVGYILLKIGPKTLGGVGYQLWDGVTDWSGQRAAANRHRLEDREKSRDQKKKMEAARLYLRKGEGFMQIYVGHPRMLDDEKIQQLEDYIRNTVDQGVNLTGQEQERLYQIAKTFNNELSRQRQLAIEPSRSAAATTATSSSNAESKSQNRLSEPLGNEQEELRQLQLMRRKFEGGKKKRQSRKRRKNNKSKKRKSKRSKKSRKRKHRKSKKSKK